MPIPLWYLYNIQYIDTGEGMRIIVTTDRTCHLWMRWTHTQPHITRKERDDRGLRTLLDYHYCFDNYHDNEQEEGGDTLTHTFTKEPWAICETRWFYFWGTINELECPSTSCIFKYHRQAPIHWACDIDLITLDETDTALYKHWRIAQQIISPKDCKFNFFRYRIGPWNQLQPYSGWLRIQLHLDHNNLPWGDPIFIGNTWVGDWLDGQYYQPGHAFDDLHLGKGQKIWAVLLINPPPAGWSPSTAWRGSWQGSPDAGLAARAIDFDPYGKPIWQYLADFPPKYHHFRLDWK